MDRRPSYGAIGALGRACRTLPAFAVVLALFVCLTDAARAQVHGYDLWQEISEPQAAARLPAALKSSARRQIVPQAYRTLALNRAAMSRRLAVAPQESPARPPALGVEILLPLPQGGYGRFRVLESPLMEPALAAQFPEIKNFIVQGIDDPTASGRIDTSPKGLRAMVISAGGTFFIDPYWSNSDEASICYAKSDFVATEKMQEWSCAVVGDPSPVARAAGESAAPSRPTGASLRVYRAAIAATGEYTTFHGGTVAGALAAINTSLARVNAIYERDFCIRMVLVANNSSIIYTNASTDPYTNNNGSTMLSQNQTNIDNVIGSANYDIGHVFSTGGGGVASLASVCVSGRKAQGVTGSSSPVGDPFDVDYVAHEMGHQFAGNHTFNAAADLQWRSTTAFEPGSGSTIMAYAGIVSGQDLQRFSDDHFHTGSYTEIDNYTTTGNGRFAFQTNATGNNVPVIAPLTNYTIPARTPFALTASATDADGDALTYCWEEYDLGPQQNPATANPRDNGSSPIFRSYSPTTNATRMFPSLRYILANTNIPPATYTSNGVTGWATGEAIPTTSRTMTYRVSVRDNRAGGGGHNWASTQVTTVSNAGPFRISSQNTAASLAAGSPFNVAWDVAGTTAAPISAANVKISLSTNGGTNFPIVLAESVPNNGSASVTIPAGITTAAGRLKVEALGNIFFDINDVNVTVGATAAPSIIANGAALLAESCPNGALDPGELATVSFGLLNVGSLGTTNLTAKLLDTNGITAVTTNPVSYGVLAAGGTAQSRNFELIADGACGSTVTAVLELKDGTNNLGTVPFSFVLGTTTESTTVFSNAASITIRDNTSATPYPSSVAVAGLSGQVTKATVSLRGFSHTYPEDVDIILVAPDGRKVSLMSAVGGGTDAVNANVTFDDAAGAPIGSAVVTGTYTPSGIAPSMPAPAPAGPYAGSLGEFAATSPNGTWSLYVADSAASDAGSISGGWSISLTTGEPVCCEEPLPPVITSPLSASATVGQAFSYQITALNSPVSFGAAGLPPGLTVNASTGVISGVPTTAGTSAVSITASNSLGLDQATLTINVARAREVVFSENMRAPVATTSIVNHTFQNSGRQTFAGTADVRATTVSTNYTGASGQGNVFFATNGTAWFQISGINTFGFTDLALSLGHFKHLNAANNELIIEVSADGASYTPLTYTRPTGSGTANWRLVQPIGNIPSTANLRLRFRQTSTTSEFRVDDVLLTGLPPALPSIAAAATTTSSETEMDGATTYQVIRGTAAALSVSASDDGGEGNLTYTWSASGVGGVTFSPNGSNGSKTSAATFAAAGDYTLTVTVRNPAGGTVTSAVPVRVKQTATSIAVSPSSASIAFGGTQVFTAQQHDQFANPMAAQPSFAWSVSGGGTIGSSGLFTAGQAGGPYTVTASADSVSSTAQVTVREWIEDQPFALLVTNPAAPVFTSNSHFFFAGLSGANIADLLSWSNRLTGQVGTFGKSAHEWNVTVPLAIGTNTLDFRGSYEVQEGADSGSSGDYADGWSSGDNGGTVFLPWQLQIGSGGDAFVVPDTNNNPGGRIFGLWSGAASSAFAARSFPALSGGGAVSLDFRNSGLSTAGRMGFEFADAQGNPRLVFHSAASGEDYRLHDAGGTNTTGWTNEGADFAVLKLLVDSANGYTVRLDDSELSGALLPGGAVAQLRIFSEAASEAPTFRASDKMQYPAESLLANQSGGTGFSAAWFGGNSTITNGSPPFLSWVRLGTTASTRTLSAPVTTGVQPVYLSMVVRSGDFTAGNFSGFALTDSSSAEFDRLFIGIPWTRDAFGVDLRENWSPSDFRVISNFPILTPHLIVCGLVPGSETNRVDVKLWTTTNTAQDLSSLINQSPVISFTGAQGKVNFTFNQIKLHGDFAGAMEFAEVGIVDIPDRAEHELLFRNLRWESTGTVVSAPSVWFNLAKTDGLPDVWWNEHSIPVEHRVAAGDWDGDGLSNAMEYFTGLNPAADDAAQAFVQSSETGLVHFDYRRSKSASGIEASVNWSLNLDRSVSWSSQGVTEGLLEDHADYEWRRATVPWSSGDRTIFLRLDLQME
jgi:subtilisin-like proprotein convertase family protein